MQHTFTITSTAEQTAYAGTIKVNAYGKQDILSYRINRGLEKNTKNGLDCGYITFLELKGRTRTIALFNDGMWSIRRFDSVTKKIFDHLEATYNQVTYPNAPIYTVTINEKGQNE